jgi:predicted RNase H-like HicB family nuclease
MNTQGMKAADLHYSVVIQWDPRDAIYIATVPELLGAAAHGTTYEEAIANIQEAIEAWIAGEDPATLPVARRYNATLRSQSSDSTDASSSNADS